MVTFVLGLIIGLIVKVSRDPVVDSLRRENCVLRDLPSTQQKMIDHINEVLRKPLIVPLAFFIAVVGTGPGIFGYLGYLRIA